MQLLHTDVLAEKHQRGKTTIYLKEKSGIRTNWDATKFRQEGISKCQMFEFLHCPSRKSKNTSLPRQFWRCSLNRL